MSKRRSKLGPANNVRKTIRSNEREKDPVRRPRTGGKLQNRLEVEEGQQTNSTSPNSQRTRRVSSGKGGLVQVSQERRPTGAKYEKTPKSQVVHHNKHKQSTNRQNVVSTTENQLSMTTKVKEQKNQPKGRSFFSTTKSQRTVNPPRPNRRAISLEQNSPKQKTVAALHKRRGKPKSELKAKLERQSAFSHEKAPAKRRFPKQKGIRAKPRGGHYDPSNGRSGSISVLNVHQVHHPGLTPRQES